MEDKTVEELRSDLRKYKIKCEKMSVNEGKNKYLNAKKNVDAEISRRHVILLERAAELIAQDCDEDSINWMIDFKEQVI